MTRPPPRSTLFPYTTLFDLREEHLEQLAVAHPVRIEAHLDRLRVVGPPGADRLVVGRGALRSSPDRKSTRLNSSHRCISYAVFCLKKKNNTLQRTTQSQQQP